MDASLIARTNFLPRFNARSIQAWLIALLLIAAALFTTSTQAAVDLRVESRPITNPIDAYVTVTDVNGNPVGNLTAGSFTVTLDGQQVTNPPPTFSTPPSQNPASNVSVVFAMDYSPSTSDPVVRAAMEQAVVTFVNDMHVGDYAAIVKYNFDNPNKASVVQPFTQIDDGGTGDSALTSAATSPYPGTSSNIFDGISVALDHIAATSTLPAGPKAVIVLSDGLDNSSTNTLNEVITQASGLGVPLFTIAVGSATTVGQNTLNSLAARTGGNYIPLASNNNISDAYQTIATRLDNGYLLSFASSITDCSVHTLQVTVTGQAPVSKNFTRCDSLTVPSVVGMAQASATTAITGGGFVVGTVTQQSSSTMASGNVISQNPASGTTLAGGSAINLVVSTGPAPGTVPNVVGMTQAAATTAITGAGFTVTVTQQSSATVPSGSVISQNPAGGTSAAAGSAVGLVVSTGPAPGTVPNVVGMTQAAATTAITAAGFTVGTVTQQSSATVASGSVISQSPAGGTSAAAGSAVGLVVSSGPAPGGGGGGGGGGGALGLLELLAGFGMVVAARRRKTAPRA